MKLSDCIVDYLHHIRYERGLAKTTCLHYQCWLRHFTDWLSENGHPAADLDTAFSLPVLRRYQYAKSKSGVRPRTVHSAFHSLRGMGEFLLANGLIEENPVKQLTLPKKDAAVRLTVNDDDVRRLFDACDLLAKPRQIALTRAVLCVLCYGGLRRQEVCDLRIEDYQASDRAVLVRSGKGSKSRRVFVCQDAAIALQEWIAVRETDCRHDYLFAIDRARRLHLNGIASLIETLKAAAGFRDNNAIKPHSLRHWCATNLLRNGANLRDVQQFLGHSSIEVTAHYLHSDEEQLRTISELTALRMEPKSLPDKMTRLSRQIKIASGCGGASGHKCMTVSGLRSCRDCVFVLPQFIGISMHRTTGMLHMFRYHKTRSEHVTVAACTRCGSIADVRDHNEVNAMRSCVVGCLDIGKALLVGTMDGSPCDG